MAIWKDRAWQAQSGMLEAEITEVTIILMQRSEEEEGW